MVSMEGIAGPYGISLILFLLSFNSGLCLEIFKNVSLFEEFTADPLSIKN